MVNYSWIDRGALRWIGRPVSHLTPRYLLDRFRLSLSQRRAPGSPWLTADAITVLNTALRKDDNGLEHGSGASTIWLARKTNHLISIEHSLEWYKRVNQGIESEGLKNVACRYIPASQQLVDDPYRESYVEADPTISPASLDYVVVDGWYRDECAVRAVELLKPGGILILDNANWFLPHATRSPFSVATPASALWSDFSALVAHWRLIWTSNGVWDTALWFKTS
jgi:hypothetical protein